MSSLPETRRADQRHAWPLVLMIVLLSLPAPAAARQDAPGAPTGLQVTSKAGQVVTITWTPPVTGATPTGYVLSGGLVPGETLAAITILGNVSSFTFNAPIGSFSIRVHAQAGEVAGPPSDDIPLDVGLPSPPRAPRNFSATVDGDVVSLSWSNSYDGGAPTSVVLQAEGTLTGAVPLGLTEGIAFAGVPAGPYTLSLVAVNAAGVSEATDAVEIVVGGGRTDTSSPERISASDARVRYQPLDAERLDQLAGREGLGAVVSGASSEWERMLLLKDWTAAQFPEGNPEPYPPWDAMTILDWIRGGVTGGFCGQYSQVLLQALASQGYTARYVEAGPPDNPYNHFVTEVWSNQFDKWVLLDADFNLHFERNGVPQSVLEVHDALLAGEASRLAVVYGTARDGHPFAEQWALRTAELYYYVRLHLKADHLSAWQEAAFDRYNDMVEWSDARVVPWERSEVPSAYAKERLTRYRTDDRALFDTPLNHVTAQASLVEPGTVHAEVSGGMFQIDHYELRERFADGSSGAWQPFFSAAVEGPIDQAAVGIEVRGVNVRGVASPSTTLTFDSLK